MVWLVVGVVTMVVAFNALFVITELERAVLLRFGKVVQDDLEPGLHVKIPFIDKVRKFDGRVLTLDAPPERFLTLEKQSSLTALPNFRSPTSRRFIPRHRATSSRQARCSVTESTTVCVTRSRSERCMRWCPASATS
jgi:regulator of protease activity HflC (stomatin/prohibitin superfamily)